MENTLLDQFCSQFREKSFYIATILWKFSIVKKFSGENRFRPHSFLDWNRGTESGGREEGFRLVIYEFKAYLEIRNQLSRITSIFFFCLFLLEYKVFR